MEYIHTTNPHRLDRIEAFFSPDFIWHQMNGKDSRSSEDSSAIAIKRWLFTVIPDVHYSIDQIVAEGDMVVVNTTVIGTAKGEMFGLPAAKKISFQANVFLQT